MGKIKSKAKPKARARAAAKKPAARKRKPAVRRVGTSVLYIHDKGGKFVVEYSADVQGKGFRKLAEQYVRKHGGFVSNQKRVEHNVDSGKREESK